MSIEDIIQKDLDDGKFLRICSNETNFKEYLKHIIFVDRNNAMNYLTKKYDGQISQVQDAIDSLNKYYNN